MTSGELAGLPSRPSTPYAARRPARTIPPYHEPKRQGIFDEIRSAALEKLGKINIKVGYPEQWIDFSALDIRPDDHFGNVQRASRFAFQRQYDPRGNLRNWWTPVADRRFKQRTDILVDQYSRRDVARSQAARVDLVKFA